MKMIYDDWISINYPTSESALNQCRLAATAMVRQYAELELQVGFINGQMHCWCKHEDGFIVDPTAHQFEWAPKYEDYKFAANYLLRKDQVEEDHCIVHLDNGKTVICA